METASLKVKCYILIFILSVWRFLNRFTLLLSIYFVVVFCFPSGLEKRSLRLVHCNVAHFRFKHFHSIVGKTKLFICTHCVSQSIVNHSFVTLCCMKHNSLLSSPSKSVCIRPGGKFGSNNMKGW